MKLSKILICALLPLGGLMAQTDDYPFRNPDLPLEERIEDLLSRLTLEEKVQMMKHESPAIPRLGNSRKLSGWRLPSTQRLCKRWAK